MMKLTKYEHACFTLEKDGKLAVVDPGNWTSDLPALESVVAIVVTHEHADHFDVNALGALIAHNPEAIIYAPNAVTRQLGNTLPHQSVAAGETAQSGPFRFEFFGGKHAVIHPSLDMVANLGVMINGCVYYPGDSFARPDKAVDWLALPVWAPWLKLSEAIDFVNALKPVHVFPTHDAIASTAGKQLVDRLVPSLRDVDYQRLTEPIDING